MENFLEHTAWLHKGWRRKQPGVPTAPPSLTSPAMMDDVTTSGSCIPRELITNAGAQRLPASGPQVSNIP